MAEPVPTTPPPVGQATVDPNAQESVMNSLAGSNVAAQGAASSYSYSQFSQSAIGGTVTVPGLKNVNGSDSGATGWAGLSDTVHYAIYAGAGALALIVIGIVTWLLVRRSRRKKQEARMNARMTQRSSFASPMHTRDTLQPHQGGAFALAGQSGMDSYKPAMGRMDSSHSLSSMDKSRFAGGASDVQSVHSVPPAYYGRQPNASSASLPQGNPQDQHHFTAGNGNSEETKHDMLANVNTSLSSFKPVPPPGSVAPQNQASYPPAPQHQPAHRLQQQQYQQQQEYQQAYNSQQEPQYSDIYAQYTDEQPTSPVRSPPRTASRQQDPYAQQGDQSAQQAYYTPDNSFDRSLSPTSPQSAGQGHRYRQPPQNRHHQQSQQQQQQYHQQVPQHSPSYAEPYQNPYSAFVEDDSSAAYGDDRQQYQYDNSAEYAPSRRTHQQHPSAGAQHQCMQYENYRQY